MPNVPPPADGPEEHPLPPPDPSTPAVTDIDPQAFRLDRELCRTARGMVFSAHGVYWQGELAVKFYRDVVARTPGFRTRLRHGAAVSATLDYPGLVRAWGCGEREGHFFLAMELAPGEALSRLLQAGSARTPTQSLLLIRDCALMLKYAASCQAFHGRLHPGDVLVADDGAHLLGVALGERPEHPPYAQPARQAFEPLIYAAPEALPSQRVPEDPGGLHAQDLYSLGALLFHLLTGQPPWQGTDESAVVASRDLSRGGVPRWPHGAVESLPLGAVSLVNRLLLPAPGERGDYDTTLAALGEALAEAGAMDQSAIPTSYPVEGAYAPPPGNAATGPTRIVLPGETAELLAELAPPPASPPTAGPACPADPARAASLTTRIVEPGGVSEEAWAAETVSPYDVQAFRHEAFPVLDEGVAPAPPVPVPPPVDEPAPAGEPSLDELSDQARAGARAVPRPPLGTAETPAQRPVGGTTAITIGRDTRRVGLGQRVAAEGAQPDEEAAPSEEDVPATTERTPARGVPEGEAAGAGRRLPDAASSHAPTVLEMARPDLPAELHASAVVVSTPSGPAEVFAAGTQPDARGFFGGPEGFGGRFIPETLMPACEELERAYLAAREDPAFQEELAGLLREYAGRPNPLTFAARVTADLGGAKVYLKREDLNHTGSHKINNTLGQVLLARRMGKRRVIAETGAGQHGVATATAAALFGLECAIYMGAEDMRRQALNVFRMELLGAKVVCVETGQRTLKDATNEAFRDWMASMRDTHYVIGSTMGPHPFPMMVRDFQSVIGREVKEQLEAKEGRLPDAVIACVGGGSNAMGIFHAFLGDRSVRLVGVEAAGEGLDGQRHAATLNKGAVGVLHGMRTYVLQDDDGQTAPVHSVSAGLDYPGVGPEHAWLKATGRAEYLAATDAEALEALQYLARMEGIIPALESAHAVACARPLAREMGKGKILAINISGRGDKDCEEVQRILKHGRH